MEMLEESYRVERVRAKRLQMAEDRANAEAERVRQLEQELAEKNRIIAEIRAMQENA